MTSIRTRSTVALAVVLVLGLLIGPAHAQQPKPPQQEPFQPQVGQAGKDVVWVPTSEALVEKMLDMAAVTPQDFVMDLGSGDGRNIIAAAKRGARAMGVEFNPDMVRLSRSNAENAGVADKATFVEGDMFEAEFSQATVLALFLLPDNLMRLRSKFFDMKPGTRIVMNTFAIPEWEADVTENIERDCQTWCTSLLYFVPAKVEGIWRLPQGEVTLKQSFQKVSGTVGSGSASTPIANGRLRGDQLTFSSGGSEYNLKVNGDTIAGVVTSGGGSTNVTATRAQ
jgi:precorrin-6B methylase 2